jgi:DNA-directed RNA polymerase subunit beta'
MQAFEPTLIEGKAIQLHPLVCTAFNADFDGDQMAVHVPLSIEAQLEARVLMMSTNNILSPASGRPIIVPTQDIVLGCYYMTRLKPFARGEGMTFSGPDEVRAAYDADVVEMQAQVKCRIQGKLEETTVGRVLMYDIIPDSMPFSLVNKVMGKKELASLIDRCYRISGQKETVILADRLRTLGYTEATRAGISVAMINMEIPKAKEIILNRCREEVEEITNQYIEGLITNGERYNKVIDIWSKAAEEIAVEMMKNISTDEVVSADGSEKKTMPSFNPLYIMADSGARGSTQQLKQLAGMRGLMAKPSGEIIETPITANFREGLTVLQYFISTHGARKGLADTALKTANSGYLTRRLVDVAQDSIITEFDCGTLDGIEITPLVEGNDIIEGIGDRILGRTALEDVFDAVTGDVLVPSGTEIDESLVTAVEDAGITRVKIRSVLTCQSRRGICINCYGRDLARGQKANIGEAVGVIAAQSIGEPGTQLTMRTFHIGGIASGSAQQSSHENRGEGIVQFENVQTVVRRDGARVAMNRQGEIKIVDAAGRERETYPVVYGALIKVNSGDTVKPGTTLVEWDPHSVPILTEVEGSTKYGDLVDGVTVTDQVDEATGLSHKVVTEAKDASARPRVSIKDVDGNTIALSGGRGAARYLLPRGAVLMVQEGDQVFPGDILAKVHREASRTKDITGGLPRVAELFEARKPKDFAVISEIDGTVSFGKDTKGKRKVLVTPELGDAREYLIPKGKHISVHEGDFVRAGDPLMDGSANPHDILRVLGEKALAKYLVDEIQEVYRLQGVKINDKHIEVIVRQMLRRVRIKDSGDTTFLMDEQVEKQLFEIENERVLAQGGTPAVAEPLLLGITKASLSTESWISGASFQETTKVLTEAAVSSKVDYLRGLKENVTMGRLVPAGTGLPNYQYLNVQVEDAGAYEDSGLIEDLPFELLESA